MNRTLRRSMLPLAVSLFAGVAAAMPPIMDRVPENAALVIVCPNIEKLEKDVNGLMQAAGVPIPFSADMFLSKFNAQGVSKNGAIAIIMQPPASIKPQGGMNPKPGSGGAGMEDTKGVVLFQTDDFAKLTTSLNAAKDGDFHKVTVQNDNGEDADIFFKKLDANFAAISNDKGTLAAFDAKPGNEARHKSFFGKNAESIADNADIAVFWDIQRLRPAAEEMMHDLEDMAAMGGAQAEGQIEAMKKMFDAVIRDAVSGVTAFKADALGIAIDQTAIFKPDSQASKIGTKPGNAGAILKRLPATNFLVVTAMDYSNPDLRALFKDLSKVGAGAEQEGIAKFMQAFSNSTQLDSVTGMGQVIGAPPSLFSGMLTQMVQFTATADAPGYITSMSTTLKDAMEKNALGSYEYKPGIKEIAGVKVGSYQLALDTDALGPGAQMMPMLYGPGDGPGGYIAAVDGGVIQTMAKSSELMTLAINAAKGEGTIAGDKLINAVAEKLPKGRIMETYIGTRAILKTVSPMIAQFTGAQLDLDLPESIAPMALGIGTGENGMHATFYVPVDSIKAFASFGMQLKQAVDKKKGGDEEMDPAPAKDPAGKPKF